MAASALHIAANLEITACRPDPWENIWRIFPLTLNSPTCYLVRIVIIKEISTPKSKAAPLTPDSARISLQISPLTPFRFIRWKHRVPHAPNPWRGPSLSRRAPPPPFVLLRAPRGSRLSTRNPQLGTRNFFADEILPVTPLFPETQRDLSRQLYDSIEHQGEGGIPSRLTTNDWSSIQ